MLRTPTGDANKGLQRAMRVEGRLNQRGMYSPSAPGGTLAGNEGALAAWAEAMAEKWSSSGYLFKAVEDGGLGVTRARFRVSGYLTDSGRVPSAAGGREELAAADGPGRCDACADHSA